MLQIFPNEINFDIYPTTNVTTEFDLLFICLDQSTSFTIGKDSSYGIETITWQALGRVENTVENLNFAYAL